MCQFKIVPLEKELYDAIIFSESYESPLAYLDEVTEEIKKQHMTNVKILFDVLLSMGNTSERFIEAFFDGEAFDLESFQVVEVKKDDTLRQFCTNFFFENSELLEYSILTPIQKELLKKGITI